MIIEPENIVNYLNPFSDKYDSIRKTTKDKLLKQKEEKGMHGLPSLEHIFIEHQVGKISLRKLALEIEINLETIRNLFKKYELPTFTQAEAVRENWKDEEFRKRQAEAVREARNDPKNLGKYFVPTLFT